MKRWLSVFLFLFILCPALAHADERQPVSVSESSSLALRVLTRPLAALYKSPSEETVLQSNLPTFHPYFVYTRPSADERGKGGGWYEVGTDDKGTVVGWLKGEDVFEWKQTMCLTYTHPEGRNPVLMFETREALEGLAGEDDAKRAQDAQSFYSAIDDAAKSSAPLPDNFPILSMEPKMAVDLTKQFYLLPILEYEAADLSGREGRLLKVVAVSGSGEKSRESSNIKKNDDYLRSSAIKSQDKADKLDEVRVDIVWVVDTTLSMSPYIKKATEIMSEVSSAIAADPALKGKIAFGVWGYRDDPGIPQIDYQTKNYTPELLPIEDWLKVMKTVDETKADTDDIPEDMFAGVRDALMAKNWRENSIKLIILVGDAPSHELGHKWNSSGMDEQTLRALADQKQTAIVALHLKPPKRKKFFKLAENQFKALSMNAGCPTPLYWAINANDMDAFGKYTKAIAQGIVDYVSAGREALAETTPKQAPPASKDPLVAKPETPAPPAAGDAPSSEDIRGMLKAASVMWLGSQSNTVPPRDVMAWVSDKDLVDPSKQALDVRLLLNKRQLNSLAVLLEEVLMAGQMNQISGKSFFDSLQAASAVASRDPSLLASAPNLAESGLIPDFLEGLPYHSQLMDMNNDLWASWGPDEQDYFLSRIEAKVSAYKSLHDDPDVWVQVNQGDDPSEFVAPIPLELLP